MILSPTSFPLSPGCLLSLSSLAWNSRPSQSGPDLPLQGGLHQLSSKRPTHMPSPEPQDPHFACLCTYCSLCLECPSLSLTWQASPPSRFSSTSLLGRLTNQCSPCPANHGRVTCSPPHHIPEQVGHFLPTIAIRIWARGGQTVVKRLLFF